MNKMPLVSIVIPTIDGREKYLHRAIDSVKQQSYRNIELIVINENKKANVQRNIGINRSNGEFIAFLDDDDIWMPDKISKQTKEMEKNPDCPIVVCYSKDYRFNRVRIDRPPMVVNQVMVANRFNYSSTSCYLVRKSFFDTLGCFDENLPSAQEYELAIRFSKDNNLRCVPEVLVEQYPTDNQISMDWKKKRKGLSMVYIKHKRVFNNASFLNYFKLIGINIVYLFANIFGSKIYILIDLMRDRSK